MSSFSEKSIGKAPVYVFYYYFLKYNAHSFNNEKKHKFSTLKEPLLFCTGILQEKIFIIRRHKNSVG